MWSGSILYSDYEKVASDLYMGNRNFYGHTISMIGETLLSCHLYIPTSVFGKRLLVEIVFIALEKASSILPPHRMSVGKTQALIETYETYIHHNLYLPPIDYLK